MLLQECRKCRALIPFGKKVCDTCQPAVDAAKEEHRQRSMQKYNKQRDPKYSRFYKSAAWITTSRKKLLDEEYRCEECGARAKEVHHQLPIQTPEGWKKRLDYDGLIACCVDCHNRFHGRFQKKKQ